MRLSSLLAQHAFVLLSLSTRVSQGKTHSSLADSFHTLVCTSISMRSLSGVVHAQALTSNPIGPDRPVGARRPRSNASAYNCSGFVDDISGPLYPRLGPRRFALCALSPRRRYRLGRLKMMAVPALYAHDALLPTERRYAAGERG
ncbi:hypothetical protein C8Q80DRAFT_203924 [Daedaleopsis nitida]|nr:hypothetical protein C8Q80DRAFT_203924 [Daedaleopsis nitida]